MIETTGVPVLIEQGLQSLHPRGKIVLIGVPPLGYSLSVNVIEHINVGYDFSPIQEYKQLTYVTRPAASYWDALKEIVCPRLSDYRSSSTKYELTENVGHPTNDRMVPSRSVSCG